MFATSQLSTDWPLAGVTVQPNVTTRDHCAGVQTGHLGLVTASGFESLQQFPRGFHVLGK